MSLLVEATRHMGEYLEIVLAEHTPLRRRVIVRSAGAVVGDLWYEAITPVVRPFSGATLDFAAIALLPYAMRQRTALHIVGPVTRSLLANLEEYQDAWVRWRPDLFGRVNLTAETLLDTGALAQPQAAANAQGAVLAFSGGLDSTYALIANHTRALGLRSKTIATLAMVHGFDIPLQDEAAFEAASAKAARLGEAFDVPLQRVRTNWRAWSPQWVLTFGIGLSSVLQQFSGDHDAALLSGDKAYGHETFPWGTNSVTNHLMSSREFPLIGVKYGATRTEKAQLVGQHPLARELVRVCWAGADLSKNCGHCEKCLRTKLSFLAAGAGVIPALGDLDLAELANLSSNTLGGVDGLEEILAAEPGLPPDVYAALLPVVERERAKYIPVPVS